MLDHDGLPKVVVKQRPDATIVHDRNAGSTTQTAQIIGRIAVKAEIKAFMRKIAPTVIAPPFVRCFKEHAWREDPTFEIIGIDTVGLNEPGRKAGFGKWHCLVHLNSVAWVKGPLFNLSEKRIGIQTKRKHQRMIG
jgi:hypothetical protein